MTDPKAPMECFGENFEMYEQLQSPEWQICKNNADELHVCATDPPSEVLLFWRKNLVQEDSFQLKLRRKTTYVPTNFFLKESDREELDKKCPIDNNYNRANPDICSGSYVNGAFKFYPVFSHNECQCFVFDKLDENNNPTYKKFKNPSNNDDPMLFNVTPDVDGIRIEDPQSPCMIKLQNEQRNDSSKPNIWSQMLTVKLEITIKEIPEGGEVYIISSFDPNFWKTQPKAIKKVITNGSFYQFNSTN